MSIHNLFALKTDLVLLYGLSPIKGNENFTPLRLFQRFPIGPDITFLQLTFVNCITHYTADYRCITWYSISLKN